jgi:hypothetical protein
MFHVLEDIILFSLGLFMNTLNVVSVVLNYQNYDKNILDRIMEEINNDNHTEEIDDNDENGTHISDVSECDEEDDDEEDDDHEDDDEDDDDDDDDDDGGDDDDDDDGGDDDDGDDDDDDDDDGGDGGAMLPLVEIQSDNEDKEEDSIDKTSHSIRSDESYSKTIQKMFDDIFFNEFMS